MNFTPFPTIETKNLLLRKMSQLDLIDLFEMRKDSSMHEYTDTLVEGNIDETKAYIEKMNIGVDDNKWIIWAIEHRQSTKVIGTICIWNLNEEEKSGELGYGIIPRFQGQGLMREALVHAVEYGFNVMKLKFLDAYTEENNDKSIKLLETCKFTEISRVDEDGYSKSQTFRMVVYRLMA
ncbi:GNAT family N-acetyltransferase [Paenisporosarcina sp. TG-14]|uniref:GNAT family N-acetyltransferase n=1 Tax=Paenisporosarcina sp. TG-14 TaxID=1231057 RepID=UPI00031844DF|nr:GNAT family N-acetyltransferase [Paenisporosarcina sp. TG-14]